LYPKRKRKSASLIGASTTLTAHDNISFIPLILISISIPITNSMPSILMELKLDAHLS
jgi:hypothetical protein